MATETVTHAQSQGVTTKAQALRDRALRLLQEMEEESGKAFAIASAGRAMVSADQINERHLFESIEDILGDAELQNSLQGTITELAALAEANRV